MNFSGLNLATGAANTDESVIAADVNFLGGSLKGRLADTKLNTSGKPTFTTFQGGCVFGSVHLLVYDGYLYTMNGSGVIARATGAGTPDFHTTNRINFETLGMNGYAVICDGSGAVKTWDGSSLRTMGPPSAPSALAVEAKAPTQSAMVSTAQGVAVGVPTGLGASGGTEQMVWAVSAITADGETLEVNQNAGTAGNSGYDTTLILNPVTGAVSYEFYMLQYGGNNYDYTNTKHCSITGGSGSPSVKYNPATDTWTQVGAWAKTVSAKGIPSYRLKGQALDAFGLSFLKSGDAICTNITIPCHSAQTLDAHGQVSAQGAAFAGTLNVYESATAFSSDPTNGTLVLAASVTVPASVSNATICGGSSIAAPTISYSGSITMKDGKYYAVVIQPSNPANKVTCWKGAGTYTGGSGWTKSTTWSALAASNGPSGVSLTGYGGTSGLTGDYIYTASFLNSTRNIESDMSATAAITLAVQAAQITYPVDALPTGVDKINIWRIGGTASDYRRVKQIAATKAFNTTLSAGFTTGNTALSVASSAGMAANDLISIKLDNGNTHYTTVNVVPDGTHVTITNGLPSAAASGKAVKGYFSDLQSDGSLTIPANNIGNTAFPSGLKLLRYMPYAGCLIGTKNDGVLYLSKKDGGVPANIEIASGNEYTVGSTTNPVKGLIITAVSAIAILQNGAVNVSGSNPGSLYLEPVKGAPGSAADCSVVDAIGGGFYLAKNGIVETSGGYQFQKLTELTDKVQANYVNGGEVGAFFDRRFFLASQTATEVLILDMRRGKVEASTTALAVRGFWTDGALLYYADSAGDVYKYETGTRKNFSWQGVPLDFDDAFTKKNFEKLEFDYIGDITVTPYLDGAAQSTIALSSSSRLRQEAAFNVFAGYRFALKFDSTSATAELYGYRYKNQENLMAG